MATGTVDVSNLPNLPDDVEFVDAESEPAPKDKRKYDDRGSTGSEAETPISKTTRFDSGHESPATSTKPKKPGNLSFADMVYQTFNTQSFVESMAPVLATIMAPIIQSTVSVAITELKEGVLGPLMETNGKLSETVQAQTDIINQQKHLLNSQQDHIDKLESNLKDLYVSNEDLIYKLNDLEQYGRRNSVRMYNVPIPNQLQSETELTEHVVQFINSEVLKPDSDPNSAQPSTDIDPVSLADVERCHFVGRGKKQIIIKFTKYHTKRRVFMNKKKLKNNPGKVFMSEDLTKINHELVKILMDEKFVKKTIFGFWTRDGSIFVKGRKDDAPTKIMNKGDIMKLLRSLASRTGGSVNIART